MKIKEMNFEKYDFIEIYEMTQVDFNNSLYPFHTDSLKDYIGDNLNEVEEREILEYQYMDEEDYNRSLLANCGESFSDMYEKDMIILTIIVKKIDE